MEWTEERPWGRFKNIFESGVTKVKLIEVDPYKRLSYQSHQGRRESWTVINGRAHVLLDDSLQVLYPGDHIDIPANSKHRLSNDGNETLQVIEVQTGAYFGEDDIRRFEDDFGRNHPRA